MSNQESLLERTQAHLQSVMAGPLMGIQGELIRVKNLQRLVINAHRLSNDRTHLQRLYDLADSLEDRPLSCLLSHTQPPHDGGPRASQSSTSTGMW